MKKSLAIVAVCLMAGPAMAGEVTDGALSSLGLGGMEVMSDADGMQVRGLSSNASAAGGSLIFGQLTYIDQFGQNFVAGADINTNRATAENAGLNAFSNAATVQGSAVNASLAIAPSLVTPGFNGSFSGFAGDASNGFAGRGFATAN